MSGRGKGGKGLGKGGAKRHRKVLRDNIQGTSDLLVSSALLTASLSFRYHQTRYSSSRSSRWCETYFWFDLRRSARCPEDLPRERHSRRCDLHGTRQAKDSDGHGRRLRSETTRSHPVRFRLISSLPSFLKTQQPSLGLPFLHSKLRSRETKTR